MKRYITPWRTSGFEYLITTVFIDGLRINAKSLRKEAASTLLEPLHSRAILMLAEIYEFHADEIEAKMAKPVEEQQPDATESETLPSEDISPCKTQQVNAE